MVKILVICQYYSPEPFRIADICEALVEKGHEVDVVTSFPNYPMGEIYDGYKNGEHRDEKINGVNVHRVFTIGRKTGALYKFLNYYAYSIASTLYVSKLKKEYDVVFVNQLSPVMMAEAALKYKRKFGKKVILYCLDLWPESLTAGGVSKDGFIYKVFEKISARIYKSSDKILVTSKSFIKHFEGKLGIDEKALKYLPQYAEDVFKPEPLPEKDTVDLTFAGNIGTAQSVETIIKAAKAFDKEKVKFHIVGDGSALEDCKRLVSEKNIENVIFYGRKPVEEMPEFYRISDAMLVTLSDDPLISLTLPGKVQSYMAAGKPIIGAINGETVEVVNDAKCGFCAPAEDSEALVECIKEFLECDRVELGKNAYEYYNEYFSKTKFINQLCEELKF